MSLGKQTFNETPTQLSSALTLNDFDFMFIEMFNARDSHYSNVVVAIHFVCTMNDKQSYSGIVNVFMCFIYR